MDRDVTVREVVSREFVGVSEADDLIETVAVLLAEDAETALVVRGSDPVGILTGRDVLELLADGDDPSEATVGEAMAESVPTVDPDATIGEAADRLSTGSTRHLVVVDGDEVLGVLTGRDLLATRPEPTNGPEPGPGASAGAPGSETMLAADAEAETADLGDGAGFEDQSICERCGTLSTDLVSFNGQLLCADCRDI